VPSVEQVAGTTVQTHRIVFRYPDPDHRAAGVRLWCDLDLGVDPAMSPTDAGWELRVPMPQLDCLEYLFQVDRGADGEEMVVDPGNRDVKDGAFGPHSWLALPGYREPRWLGLDPVEGVRREIAFDATVWQPASVASNDRLPMLVAHDGPEMDRYGQLTSYVAALVGAGELPPMRVALLAPGPRDERYAANPSYPSQLGRTALTKLLRQYPSDHLPVLTGQSLGALAALHATWSQPAVFGGLLLQSGSFFTEELDSQESGYSRFGDVTGFVAGVHAAGSAPPLPPVAMTCGTAEENQANNIAMRDTLRGLGVDVDWGEARQGHTWTCWRDLLDPYLTRLLQRVWSA
jgi:enterochelin esterase family protein